MNLAIDIGNSAAKMAVFDGNKLVEVATSGNDDLRPLDGLSSRHHIGSCIYSTVVPLSALCQRQLASLPFPTIRLTADTPTPITNLYRTPQTLGTDRIAAAVGAAQQFPQRNILVIDSGTCITYEFIDDRGNYHGGNISPGIQMRLKSLVQGAAQLPQIDMDGDIPEIGYDTDTAIRAGVERGVAYEMAGYVHTLSKEHRQLAVVLTGGEQIVLDRWIKIPTFADKFLVLRGLNCILHYNNNEK